MRPPQPIPISLDWLAFSVLLPLTPLEQHNGIHLYTPPNYSLQEYTGTNIYKHRFILYNDFGDKVLTLLHTPHSNIIAPNSMYVEVANRELYTRGTDILDLLSYIHEYTFQSLSRLDVAGDFEPTLEQSSIIDKLQAGSIYAQGKREGSLFHTYNKNSDGKMQRVAKCMSWGAKTTDVKFKLYNKSKELMETDSIGRTFCTKPYIPAMWSENGLPLTRDIWRLEISITSSSAYTWRGEHLSWFLTQPENYTPFYWDMISSRFTLRYNQGHKYNKNDKVAEFLPIPPPPHYRLTRKEPNSEQHHTDHAVTLRSLMKELDRPEIQLCPTIAISLLNSLHSVITHAHLEGYFSRAVGLSFESWRREYSEKFLSSK